MGDTTEISWADATFNPWVGCTKVSAGCDHCYAETQDHRWGHDRWGHGKQRARTSESNWHKPRAWNKKATLAGKRVRVFCASLADVFDTEVDSAWRADLFALIRATPMLDWMLLTKRPANIAKALPADWGDGYPNAWLGTTVEDQKAADLRIPVLLRVPARVRFLSCEPLLGAVDLGAWLAMDGVNWVIVGGESGAGARPMHPAWARSIRDQCVAAAVAFHFKQWGEWGLTENEDAMNGEFHGLQAESWVAGCMCDEGTGLLFRVGKKAAGNTLDGRVWQQFPEVA